MRPAVEQGYQPGSARGRRGKPAKRGAGQKKSRFSRNHSVGAGQAALAAKPAPVASLGKRQDVVETQTKYNNATAHAVLSDNMAHVPVRAAAPDRRAGQYFTAKQTVTKNLVIGPGETLVVAYTPLVIKGVTGYDPLPISYTVCPTASPISSLGPLIADQGVSATPQTLDATLTAQPDAAIGKVFALLKGCLVVECTGSLSADNMSQIQAIGLANLSAEPSLQARAAATTASNWYDATKNNIIAPFVAGAPLTSTVANHAASYVPRQAARAAYVSCQPPLESRRGCSYYQGTPYAVNDALAASDVLGYNPLGGALAPHVLVHNMGAFSLNILITTHSVYAVPFEYAAATTLSAYAQDEAENVCLDEDIACALSLGGVGTSLLDSALAAKEAYLCALSRCRSGKPDHVRVAAAGAMLAHEAVKRTPESFIGVRVANPGEVHRPTATAAEKAQREAIANAISTIGSHLIGQLGKVASDGLFTLAQALVRRYTGNAGPRP